MKKITIKARIIWQASGLEWFRGAEASLFRSEGVVVPKRKWMRHTKVAQIVWQAVRRFGVAAINEKKIPNESLNDS